MAVATGKRKRGVAKATSRPSSKLAAQVKMLMRMKQEKKFADKTHSGRLGQVDGTDSGAFVKLLTADIAQGDGESQRIGNSITATGFVVKQQFDGQSFTNGTRRVKTYIVRVLGSPGVNDVRDAVLDVNAMSEVRDYFSSLNYTMMRDKRISVIAQGETMLTPNTGTAGQQTPSTGELTVAVKLDDTIRYSGDAEVLPASVRYYCLTVCDNGNAALSGTSSRPVFYTGEETGLNVKTTGRMWYTDS